MNCAVVRFRVEYQGFAGLELGTKGSRFTIIPLLAASDTLDILHERRFDPWLNFVRKGTRMGLRGRGI